MTAPHLLPPKSGHAGIQLRKSGFYRARIRVEGKIRELGEFETIGEAIAARADFVARMVAEKEKRA